MPLTQVQRPGVTRDFLPRVTFSVYSFGVHMPSVQSHALTSVCKLKIL